MEQFYKKRVAIYFGSLFLFFSVQSKAFAQLTMFCGNADHNYSVNSKNSAAFTDLAWKFDAAAPVRSSAAVSANAVFFGSSRGIFYSLNKLNGKLNWIFNAGSAINSSAALHNGNVFFSDNQQVLYSLNMNTGKVNWKAGLGQSKPYDWAFDYYYSSPTIAYGQIFIGSKDGNVYNINETTGKVTWKFKTGGVVRSSPAVERNVLYVGDTDGSLFAIDAHSGKQVWQFFITGHGLKNENFGFDRRAIIASPVVAGDRIVVGGRDGFLYSVDKKKGKQLWVMDHKVSWVISSVAVKDGIVVTGTSDGHFVQGIDLITGKELWKFHAVNVVWSSPVIDGNKVYEGSHEGMLYCIDLKTGKLIDDYQAGDIIFSSPVISGSLLYFGCDDGFLYALKPNAVNRTATKTAKKYVYWEAGGIYFKYGTDVRIKRYLAENGYSIINKEKLVALFRKTDSAVNSVVVIAPNLFPNEVTDGAKNSLLRQYLEAGGKIVVVGPNPVLYKIDPGGKSVSLRSFLSPDSILSIKYGPDDTRSFKGNQPAFPTKTGIEWGLDGHWASFLSLPSNQVDIVLAKDENGLASAWVKKYNPAKGSGFVQVWIMENTTNFGGLKRVAEYGLY